MAPPSYDYDDYLSPYANTNSTGLARMLQQQHKDLLEADRARRMERMQRDLRDIRSEIEIMRTPPRMVTSTVPYSTYLIEEPEPSVEYDEIKPPRWWISLRRDPIWEFFKRPKIHV